MKHDEQSIFLLRRIPEVINYIRSTYRWLDARMFKDFDEFIDRVIFSSVRDFVSVEVTNVSYEDYERLRNKFYPIIKEIVESELMDEIKKHYNKERGIRENIIRIKQLMESKSQDVIEKYVSDKRLVDILKSIEKTHNVKFEDKHFISEIELSGDVKIENGGYDTSALEAFEKLKLECPSLYYDEDSYRTYERQAELFSAYIGKYGSIEGAMRLRAIPGFSQHHTGKAFDIKPEKVRYCVASNISKFGFILPYTTDGVRVKEPWHIYFEGL